MILLLGCAEKEPTEPAPFAYPAPDAFTLSGPGGPTRSFSAEELDVSCAALTGGPEDVEHHNLVGMYDGWLVVPWAPEDGGGGVTLYDFSDPCAPEKVGETYAPLMRETHTLGIARVDDRVILAVDAHTDESHGGIGFWDLTDPTAPEWIAYLEIPDYAYPDAYFRVALSTFWLGDRLFVSAGFNGVLTVDVTDPTAPVLLESHVETAFLAGRFDVVGNLGLGTSAGLTRTLLWDIGEPDDWELLADWEPTDSTGTPSAYYFSSWAGKYGFFARKGNGGGPIVYDLSDPTAPTFVSDAFSAEGDGGYVFRHHDRLFQGESNFGSRYDFTDPTAPFEEARIDMSGDFDTLTPIGNVAVASVDEGADPGMATLVFPWDTEPDTLGPTAELTSPADGEVWAPVTSNIGLAFDEQLEPVSVHAGSFRVWRADGAEVPGRFYAQEAIADFVPDAPLDADTTYVVEIPAGGITDTSGNPTESTLRFRFSTGPEVAEVAW